MLNQIKKIGLTAVYVALIILIQIIDFVYPLVGHTSEIHRLS